MDYHKQKEYAGSLFQLMAVKEYRLAGGRMEGLHCAEVSNGRGLSVTIAVDRCMDLWDVRACGKSFAYHSPAGLTHPAFQQPWDNRWLATFPGGFLSTCGLDNIGSPSEVDGIHYPQHGTIGNAPAEQFGIHISDESGTPEVILHGTMRQAEMFGPNLRLEREIRIRYDSDEILLTDRVKNEGYHRQPYMLLYHYNMGYPLLSEKAELDIASVSVKGRDAHANAHIDTWRQVLPPQDSFQEQCYYHKWVEDGPKTFGLHNPASNLGVHFTCQSEALDHLVQWKMMEKGTYVLGLEPCTSTIDGRADAAANHTLKSLAPGQQVENRFTIRFAYEQREV